MKQLLITSIFFLTIGIPTADGQDWKSKIMPPPGYFPTGIREINLLPNDDICVEYPFLWIFEVSDSIARQTWYVLDNELDSVNHKIDYTLLYEYTRGQLNTVCIDSFLYQVHKISDFYMSPDPDVFLSKWKADRTLAIVDTNRILTDEEEHRIHNPDVLHKLNDETLLLSLDLDTQTENVDSLAIFIIDTSLQVIDIHYQSVPVRHQYVTDICRVNDSIFATITNTYTIDYNFVFRLGFWHVEDGFLFEIEYDAPESYENNGFFVKQIEWLEDNKIVTLLSSNVQYPAPVHNAVDVLGVLDYPSLTYDWTDTIKYLEYTWDNGWNIDPYSLMINSRQEILMVGFAWGNFPEYNEDYLQGGGLVAYTREGEFLYERRIYDKRNYYASGVFYDIVERSDGKYVIGGQSIKDSRNVSGGWIVLTDSVGCLEPNCDQIQIIEADGVTVTQTHFETMITSWWDIKPAPIELLTLQASPNPAIEDLTIRLANQPIQTSFTSGQLVISDIKGRPLYQQEVMRSELLSGVTIPVYGLPSGWYVVQLKDSDRHRPVSSVTVVIGNR